MALPSGETLSNLVKALLVGLANKPTIEIVEELRLLANQKPVEK